MPSSENENRNSSELIPFIGGAASETIRSLSGPSMPGILEGVGTDIERVYDDINQQRNNVIGGTSQVSQKDPDSGKILKSMEMLIGINIDQLDVLEGIEDSLKNPKKDIENLESVASPDWVGRAGELERLENVGNGINVDLGGLGGLGDIGGEKKKKKKKKTKEKPRFKWTPTKALGGAFALGSVGMSIYDMFNREQDYEGDIAQLDEMVTNGLMTPEERQILAADLEKKKKTSQSSSIFEGVLGSGGAMAGAALGAKTLGAAGSLLGPVGTVIGGLVGGLGGAAIGAFGGESLGNTLVTNMNQEEDNIAADRADEVRKSVQERIDARIRAVKTEPENNSIQQLSRDEQLAFLKNKWETDRENFTEDDQEKLKNLIDSRIERVTTQIDAIDSEMTEPERKSPSFRQKFGNKLSPVQRHLDKESVFLDTDKVSDYSAAIEDELIKNFYELGITSSPGNKSSHFIDNEPPEIHSGILAINKIKREIESTIQESEGKDTGGNIINNTINNISNGQNNTGTPTIIPTPRRDSRSALDKYLDRVSNFF